MESQREAASQPDAGIWPDGTYALPEIMGPGVGLADVDADGHLDLVQLLLPQPGHESGPLLKLHRWEPANGAFVDRTADSGLADLTGYAQALAAGDVDADGDVDIYLANYGPDLLLLNDGAGRFGVADGFAPAGALWSSSATFCDYDGDDDLDLFVVHYLDFDDSLTCLGPSGTKEYCSPAKFDGVADRLYRNDGRGRFVDVTTEAGIVPPRGGRTAKGLGVVCTDLTGDGWMDFYVANDDEANFLWVNDGTGSFSEQASLRGNAVNRDGHPEASMGLAVGDVDDDLALDLFMTHLAGQNNTLYRARPGREMQFSDETSRARMAVADFPFTGFGCAFVDFDHDTDLDLVVANGRVYRDPPIDGATLGLFWNAYAEPNLFFENDGTGRFTRRTLAHEPIEVTRGLAVGDMDRDGDQDLVFSNVDNTLRIYFNEQAEPKHWLGVVPRANGIDALGAQVTMRGGGREWIRIAASGHSYASSSEPVAHFGLGRQPRVDEIEILWPDATRERFSGSSLDRVVVLERGTGAVR